MFCFFFFACIDFHDSPNNALVQSSESHFCLLFFCSPLLLLLFSITLSIFVNIDLFVIPRSGLSLFFPALLLVLVTYTSSSFSRAHTKITPGTRKTFFFYYFPSLLPFIKAIVPTLFFFFFFISVLKSRSLTLLLDRWFRVRYNRCISFSFFFFLQKPSSE